eukprot:TRINITY_DN8181_c0_g1_i7.p1 TRINITY_DN8181_c0_g1~~TRINITY_DN8181_c0_g1_i7.p1  ORF type:complete len:351 (+),score=54.94 TRINITY_DN8181_c0_g1_i7:104-1156(+)
MDKTVQIYTELLSVSHINTASQSFDANAYVRLSFNMDEFDADQIAGVELEVLNIVDEKRLKINVGQDTELQQWQLHCIVSGTFFHKPKLHYFPYDVQDVELKFEVWSRRDYDQGKMPGSCLCREEIGADHLLKREGFAAADFAPVALIGVCHDDPDYHYHSFELKLRVRRLPFYYLSNLVLPLFVLVSLTGCVFAISPEEVGERLSVSLTLLLTVIAYKLVVASSLPAVAYLTWLDRYSLAALLMLVLTVVQNAMAGFIPDFDQPAAIGCACVWLCINAAFAYSAHRLSQRQDALSRSPTADNVEPDDQNGDVKSLHGKQTSQQTEVHTSRDSLAQVNAPDRRLLNSACV